MTFAEKLNTVRKKAGLSQEKLAEKLCVSRQAVTKWETGAGIPDIENIMAISALFGISIDELLSDEMPLKQQSDYLFESVTEYDIDYTKKYDIKIGGARKIIMYGYDGEKIRVRLASNTISTLQSDFKLKIEDLKRRIDLNMNRKNEMTEATAKQELFVFIQMPQKYTGEIELSANAEAIELRSLECENIELEVKSENIILDGISGTVEVDCNLDMEILCRALSGAVEINQVSATSRICIPEGTGFTAVAKGFGTSISYEKDGKRTEAFSSQDSDNIIELNGFKSELVICTSEKEGQSNE